jgi:hypothetical protein
MPRLFTGVIKMITSENSAKAAEANTPTPVKKPAVSKPLAASAPVANVASKAQTRQVAKKPSATPKTTVKSPATAPAKATARSPVKAKVKTPVKAAAKSLPKAQNKPIKPAKEKKPKLVRDSFTIPKGEYTVLEDLKQRAGKLSTQIKKSELLRAGIMALAAMSDAAFVSSLKLVPTIKTGRPAKS